MPSGSHAHAGASFGIGPPSQSSHDSCTHTFRAPLPLPAPFSGAATVTSTCGMVNALVVCRCTSTTTSVCTLECEWLFLPDDMVLRGQALCTVCTKVSLNKNKNKMKMKMNNEKSGLVVLTTHVNSDVYACLLLGRTHSPRGRKAQPGSAAATQHDFYLSGHLTDRWVCTTRWVVAGSDPRGNFWPF